MPIVSLTLSHASSVAVLWIGLFLFASLISIQAGTLPGWRESSVGIMAGNERNLHHLLDWPFGQFLQLPPHLHCADLLLSTAHAEPAAADVEEADQSWGEGGLRGAPITAPPYGEKYQHDHT